MSQEIPKPLRNALSRQAVGEVHPSPDVLTAFLEHALAPVENEVVTHHLAQCAECRDVLFLASEATEEDELLEVEQLVAAAAVTRPLAVQPAQTSRVPGQAPRPKWTARLRWLVPVTALAALVAGVLIVQLPKFNGRRETAAISVVSDRAAAVKPEQPPHVVSPASTEESAKASAPAAPPKTEAQPTTVAQAAKPHPSAEVAQNAATQAAPAPPEEAAAPAANSSVLGGELGAALATAVPTQNSFAANGAARVLPGPGAAGLAKPSGLVSAKATRPLWRISPKGQVEHATAPDEWTPVLTDQPTTFRTVHAFGSNVWAGGNSGALFHSSDGGESWSKVPLASNSVVETGAIVSIHFADLLRGTVTCDNGNQWTTSDGGVTWSKH